MLFYLAKNTINGGGGGGEGAFHNSGHRLALGHVNDMRCLEKVHTFLSVSFNSLHPINNLSDLQGRVYLG